MKTLVVAYPGNERLADALCRATGGELLALAMRRFPDAETYLRIDGDAGGRTVVVACSLRDPDASFLPLAFLSDALKQSGARAVGLVAPYLAYMRQDRQFLPGEAVTSESYARRLSAQFDWLVTVDPHLHRWQSLREIYAIPTVVVHAAPVLARWIRGEIANPLVVGPDEESEQWVREVAGAVPCPYVVQRKVRHGDREVEVSGLSGIREHAGRTPVLIDDIMSTAHTMIATVDHLAGAGFPAPVCLAIHAVFAAGAYQALRSAGAARIATTDTITHESNAIGVSDLLAPPVQDFVTAAA